jgi:hypothetical protein
MCGFLCLPFITDVYTRHLLNKGTNMSNLKINMNRSSLIFQDVTRFCGKTQLKTLTSIFTHSLAEKAKD